MSVPIGRLNVEGFDDVAQGTIVQQQLLSRLTTMGPLAWRPNAPDAWVLSVSLEKPADPSSRHTPMWVKLALHGRATGPGAPYFEAREPIFERSINMRQLFPLLVRGLAVVRLQRQLSSRPAHALLPWLSSKELPALLAHNRLRGSGQLMQLFVLDELARRRAPEAIPALTELLQEARAPEALDRQRTLALRAVGALVAIGDVKAVPHLIDLAQRQGAETIAALAHAIGALGGRTAEGYLLTLASGHEHDGVRAEAAQALNTLLERE